MNDFEAVKSLVCSSPATNRCLQELQRLFASDGTLNELLKVRHSVREARSTYQIRAETAQQAGVDIWGMQDLLDRLAELEMACTVWVFHYETSSRLFSVFVLEDDGSIVGCVSVPRRD
jgi:hypothetical protein